MDGEKNEFKSPMGLVCFYTAIWTNDFGVCWYTLKYNFTYFKIEIVILYAILLKKNSIFEIISFKYKKNPRYFTWGYLHESILLEIIHSWIIDSRD